MLLKKKTGEELSKQHEKSTPSPNEIGNTNTESVSWRSHAGVMTPLPGLYQFQAISDRCLLQLSGQCLRLSTQQHISFRLLAAIKVRRGGRLVESVTQTAASSLLYLNLKSLQTL